LFEPLIPACHYYISSTASISALLQLFLLYFND
jgi:hypothetical protein